MKKALYCLTSVLQICADFSFYCSVVEEAIVALVRLYQQFTFELSESCQEPLDIKMGITMAPRGGVPVYVRQRVRTWNDTVSVAQATA